MRRYKQSVLYGHNCLWNNIEKKKTVKIGWIKRPCYYSTCCICLAIEIKLSESSYWSFYGPLVIYCKYHETLWKQVTPSFLTYTYRYLRILSCLNYIDQSYYRSHCIKLLSLPNHSIALPRKLYSLLSNYIFILIYEINLFLHLGQRTRL